MEFLITYQTAVMERPAVKSCETKDEADDQIKLLRKVAAETRMPWKIEPVLEVAQ
jgi:hypothetical protein